MEIYLEETLAYMRLRELNLPSFSKRSSHFTHRRVLVDWTCTAGERFKLSKSTIHLAIVLMDRYLDKNDITANVIPYICLVSLTVSAKFDCTETCVPKFSKLNALLKEHNIVWSPAEFRRFEGVIMKNFNWNIFIPTPTHYVDLLMPEVASASDFIHGCIIATNVYPDVVERLIEFVQYFLDISMQVLTMYIVSVGTQDLGTMFYCVF